ncbi:hypothetical protein [Pseudorhodobacter ferrugineus]|uniref:hypothetical protein n=1 Tax=Pseudorhodobacter ferrugineus TaxID=77008 RepID=UPI0003B63D0D|nr:hypothetical protein [Pseudorhodobacter ferrugineus]
MSAHSLSLLANSVDRLRNVALLDQYQILIACGQSAAQMHGPNDAMAWGIRATQLIFSAQAILDAYLVIDTCRGVKATEKLWSGQLIEHDWMKIELLDYAWQRLKPCCPQVLGFLVAMAHQAGNHGGSCISIYGPNFTTQMFRASGKNGMAKASPLLKTPSHKLVYRGGFTSEPSKLASGMCWTEDLGLAAWFADRRMGQKGDAFILSTRSDKSETLARFEHESEVVFTFNSSRSFEVIATGENECRAFLAELEPDEDLNINDPLQFQPKEA